MCSNSSARSIYHTHCVIVLLIVKGVEYSGTDDATRELYLTFTTHITLGISIDMDVRKSYTGVTVSTAVSIKTHSQ